MAFSRLDFPTPDGPVTTDALPAIAALSDSMPSPVFTLVRKTGYPALRLRSAMAVLGSRSALLRTTAAAMPSASASTSMRSMSWGMGSGERVAATTKTWSTFAAMGRTPRPSGTRRSSTLRRGSTPTMPCSAPAGSGSSRTTSPTTTLDVPSLALASENRPDLCSAGDDPVCRPIPLQHRSEQRGYHSAGARAIASSSAVFTS